MAGFLTELAGFLTDMASSLADMGDQHLEGHDRHVEDHRPAFGAWDFSFWRGTYWATKCDVRNRSIGAWILFLRRMKMGDAKTLIGLMDRLLTCWIDCLVKLGCDGWWWWFDCGG